MGLMQKVIEMEIVIFGKPFINKEIG